MGLELYHIQAANFNNVQYPGTTGKAAEYGQVIQARGRDGIIQPTMRRVSRLAPRASLQSLGCKTWLDALNDSLDAPMKALDGTNGLKMIVGQGAASASGYSAGTNHEQLAALNGLIFATGFSWGGPDDALSIALSALFTSSDGSTAALIPTQIALPAQPTPTEEYDLDSFTIGGSAVDGIEGFNLAIDIKAQQRWNQGKIYPQRIYAAGVADMMDVKSTFALSDQQYARSIGAIGTTGQVQAVFKSYNHNSATRGTSSITLTLNNCLIRLASPLAGSQGSPVKPQIEVLPSRVGGTRMLAWATT